MSANECPQPDPLENWLARPPAMTRPDDFQQTVLRQTTRVLRRRRWLRRSGWAGALAACYVAGLLTMKYLPSPQAAAPEEMARIGSDGTPPTAPPKLASSPPKTRNDASASPAALEWQAVDSREKRLDLYRQAGDRYLEEAGDVQSAVRCYRNMLNSTSTADTAISADDNWLLMALKDAKQKEKRHGKTDG